MDRSIEPRANGVARTGLMLCAIGVVVASTGCRLSGVSMRSMPASPLTARLHLDAYSRPQPGPRTQQVLRLYDLSADADPRELLTRLQSIVNREPSPENVYAFAELAYLGGLQAEEHDDHVALDLYGSAVQASYQYLFHPQLHGKRSPYDPQFRGACELYNGALEKALRIQCREKGLAIGGTQTIRTASGDLDVTVALRGTHWQSQDIGRFEFVSDYEIRGLKNHYRTHGLGVPLIAVRRSYDGEPEAAKYYPVDMSFPVTAFFRPVPPRRDPQTGEPVGNTRGVLELYDPLINTHIDVAGHRVALESDLTTPLGYFLSNPQLHALATVGLLRPEELLKMRPDRPDPIMGLYTLQPFDPNKIPVVMVHGLWSSPMTWMEMFNDLRSSPEIRDHYQIWFYLYPTGQPFWISAAQLRRDLRAARQLFDPRERSPALDQMVLVGHSMGGLLSRLQTVHSRDHFWSRVAKVPPTELEADSEVRAKLAETFYFLPSPSVRRVITLGTPHHGSRVSNEATQWVTDLLIDLPGDLIESQQELFRKNAGRLPEGTLLAVDDSVESLAPDCPAFEALHESRPAPWVTYHNVVGRRPTSALFRRLTGEGDGVVTLDSARSDDVASELIVEADHMTVHAHPAAVLEVRRILLEHLAELQRRPSAAAAEARAAEAVRDAGGIRPIQR